MSYNPHYRIRIIDNSKRRADGKRIHVDTGWNIVNYGFGDLLEPVDSLMDETSADVAEKEVTGYQFTEAGPLLCEIRGTGGRVTLPVSLG